MKGSTGGNTSTIIDVRNKRSAYMKKGKAHCKKCVYLSFGYYCEWLKKSAEHVDKPKHCKFFIDKDSTVAQRLKKINNPNLTESQKLKRVKADMKKQGK